MESPLPDALEADRPSHIHGREGEARVRDDIPGVDGADRSRADDRESSHARVSPAPDPEKE